MKKEESSLDDTFTLSHLRLVMKNSSWTWRTVFIISKGWASSLLIAGRVLYSRDSQTESCVMTMSHPYRSVAEIHGIVRQLGWNVVGGLLVCHRSCHRSWLKSIRCWCLAIRRQVSVELLLYQISEEVRCDGFAEGCCRVQVK